jgi:hypothetical protein
MPRPQLRDEIYEKQKILLDGASWRACSFKECEILINTGDFSIEYSHFNNCKLLLGEKATTVAQIIKLFNPELNLLQNGGQV